MKAKDIIKSCGATLEKVSRYGVYTDYNVKTSKGISIVLHTRTKIRSNTTDFEIRTNEELILPEGVHHHKESGCITIDGVSSYVDESIIIATLKLN